MLCDETFVISKRPVTALQISNTLTMPRHRELEKGKENVRGLCCPRTGEKVAEKTPSAEP